MLIKYFCHLSSRQAATAGPLTALYYTDTTILPSENPFGGERHISPAANAAFGRIAAKYSRV